MPRCAIPLGALLFCLAWPGAAPAQRPVAVAEERFDVDGDGKIDVVRVGDGRLTVAITGAGQALWKPFQTTGKTVDGRITWGRSKKAGTYLVGEAEIRTSPRGDTVREAIAAVLRGGKLVVLWRGEVGPVGVDGESSLAVEATGAGILRYHQRPGVVRCDGKVPHLFAEGYSFGRGKFQPISEFARIDAGAPRLTATRTPPRDVDPKLDPVAFRATAASSMANAREPRDLVPPREIDDGDPTTAWIEGKALYGEGEFVTARSSVGETEVRYLRLIPGFAKDRRAFRDYNRLKEIGLLVGDRVFRVELPEDPAAAGSDFADPYWITLPEPVPASCVSLVVAGGGVYFGRLARRGAGQGHTAISELAVLTALELSPGGPDAMLAERVAAGGRAGRRAERLLARRGAAAEKALLAEAKASDQSEQALLRLRRTLARIPAGEEELVYGLAAEELSDGDAGTFHDALVQIGAPAVPYLRALLAADDAPAAGRERAARALGAIGHGSARAALVEAAGEGPRSVRKQVAVALGRRGTAELRATLADAQQAKSAPEGREADLWRAVGLLARQRDQLESRHEHAARAIAGRLEEADGYELRYRLLDAAASLEVPVALEAAAAALRVSGAERGESAESVALRRVVVAALDRNGSPEAVAPLLTATRDPDPGVRMAAVEALGPRDEEGARADDPIAERLEDPWPEVRESAARALAPRCGRPGPARALFEADAREAERGRRAEKEGRSTREIAGVRSAALSALVSCRASGIDARLFEIARSSREPAAVRAHAIALLVPLGDRSQAKALAELLVELRREAISSSEAVALAEKAAWALGELGDASALDPLLEAARDPAFPRVRAAAVRALASFCSPEAVALFQKLRRSSERPVALAARDALAACR